MSSHAVTLSPLARQTDSPTAGTAYCRHCNDACGPDRIVNPAGAFCCAGCATVFSLLADHGLNEFYTCDINPGRSQKIADRLDPERFAPLDDPAVAARFIRSSGGTSSATFVVPAMHCASCLWLLEQLWRFDEGVGRSEADIVARTIRIDFDPARTSLRSIAGRLASLGYEPVLDGEHAADEVPTRRRNLYLKIAVAGFAFGNVMLFSIPRYVNGGPLDPVFTTLFGGLNLALSIPVLCYSAADYLRGAWRALRARTITLDVPIAMGLLALFSRSTADILLGIGEGFLDSFAGLTFFLLVGRLFQQKAYERIEFDRTVRSFLPLSVRVVDDRGSRLARIDSLKPGDVVSLRRSEILPSDATLLDPSADIDYAFVSGESRPMTVHEGDTVSAGGRLVGGGARFRLDRAVSQSRLAQLWSNPVFTASRNSALSHVLARFGFWFTVAALALAALGAFAWWPDWRMSASVITAVLIIACPCAFTLAAPIALGSAMGVLGRAGLFVREPAVVLELTRVDTIVFDKTGTLTTHAPDIDVECHGLSAAEWILVRRLAAESVHPVSRAIGRKSGALAVTGLREVAGAGLSGGVAGHRVVIGSPAFVAAETGHDIPDDPGLTWAAVDDGTPGWIRTPAGDRPGLAAALARLATHYETRLLSGDDDAERERWAPVFLGRVQFRQLPDDKLAGVQALQKAGRRVLMVGDGLNDAGALAAATVGLVATDDTACIVPACDAVISGTRLADLPELLAYVSRVPRVIGVCFAISIFYNAIGLWLALAGQLTPLATAILMPVSSLTIVALSGGLMRTRLPEILR